MVGMRLVALRFQLAHKGVHALLNQRIDLCLVDVGDFEPENITGLGYNRREESEEEDCLENA